MSVIQFGCPYCGAVAEVAASMAGQETVCPACESVLLIPLPEDGAFAEGSPLDVVVDLAASEPPADLLDFPEDAPLAPAPAPEPAKRRRMKMWQTSPSTETAKRQPPPVAGVAGTPGIASPKGELADATTPLDGLLADISSGGPLSSAPYGKNPLAREERERRRFWSNLIMLIASVLFLLAALAVLGYITSR